jgi:hypothetical protein
MDMTQNQRIKEYLKQGKSLTSLDALSMFNCFRLSARIKDLEYEGMKIKREMIITQYSKKKVAKYYL